jgi:hypothetical protein
MTDTATLTGVWDGLYSYSRTGQPESPFTAILFDSTGTLSGTIHETMKFRGGQQIAAGAFVDGTVSGNRIVFTKTYDGANGQSHTVAYDGTLSGDRGEIDGTWTIRSAFGPVTGRFLMIRARRAAETVKKRIAAKAG